ncbi:hypothetical protein BC828DRAFT_377502 [Blastocladiella britannica]|nr:hypothetical protein BC828DRAFT_377502 [Blastocladiella britannica]
MDRDRDRPPLLPSPRFPHIADTVPPVGRDHHHHLLLLQSRDGRHRSFESTSAAATTRAPLSLPSSFLPSASTAVRVPASVLSPPLSPLSLGPLQESAPPSAGRPPAARMYAAFTRTTHAAMLESLQLVHAAGTHPLSPHALSRLRQLRMQSASTPLARRRWKRLCLTFLSLKVDDGGSEVAGSVEITWRGSMRTILPMEDWDDVIGQIHGSGSPWQEHLSFGKTAAIVRSQYETRRSRCGIPPEYIRDYVNRCECQTLMVVVVDPTHIRRRRGSGTGGGGAVPLTPALTYAPINGNNNGRIRRDHGDDQGLADEDDEHHDDGEQDDHDEEEDGEDEDEEP